MITTVATATAALLAAAYVPAESLLDGPSEALQQSVSQPRPAPPRVSALRAPIRG